MIQREHHTVYLTRNFVEHDANLARVVERSEGEVRAAIAARSEHAHPASAQDLQATTDALRLRLRKVHAHLSLLLQECLACRHFLTWTHRACKGIVSVTGALHRGMPHQYIRYHLWVYTSFDRLVAQQIARRCGQ